MNSNKEIPWIHFIRVLACMMVVCLHVANTADSYPKSDFTDAFIRGVWLLTRCCVPLFFMVTGFLILPYKNGDDIVVFYRKRIPRVFLPLLFWGGIYAFLPYFLGMYDSPMAISELMLCPIKAPTRIGGILWYLFILIGIYLFIPFVSDRIYHSRRVFGAFIMFWLFTTMIPLVRDYYIHENDILGRCHYLHEFDMLVNFSGYIGFLFLGFGIRKYGDLYSDFLILGHKVGKRIYGIILILVLVVASYRHILFEYFLTIGTVFYAFCVFMLIKDFKIDTKSYFYKVLKSLSTMSFGVYLCHMLVLKCITERLFTAFSTEWHIQCLCMVLTFIISYVFVSILSIIPFKKYLVG